MQRPVSTFLISAKAFAAGFAAVLVAAPVVAAWAAVEPAARIATSIIVPASRMPASLARGRDVGLIFMAALPSFRGVGRCGQLPTLRHDPAAGPVPDRTRTRPAKCPGGDSRRAPGRLG